MRNALFPVIAISLTLSACVSQREYSDLEKQNTQLKTQLVQADSLSKLSLEESDVYQELMGDYRNSLQTIEQLRSTNLSLNNSYQEILSRYSNLVNQNRELLNTSAQVQGTLRGEVDSRSGDVQRMAQQLQQMEQELRLRDQRIREMEASYMRALNVRNQEIVDLQAQLQAGGQTLDQTQSTLSSSLGENIDNKEVSVSQTAGRIYITVSQDLLFRSGSATLDSKGKSTLRAVAMALQQEPDMDIIIEGHTDNTGSAERNWELSLNRALSVSKELQANAIAPARMTVAGRGPFAPIADNATKEGQALNRRTEIILIPKALTGGSMQKY